MLCSVYTSTYGSLDVAVLVVGDSTVFSALTLLVR